MKTMTFLMMLTTALTLSGADLLDNNRAAMLARFGSPQFAPRLGDEDHTEEFRAGDYRYIIGYRKDKQRPTDDQLMKVICVLKSRDFGHATTLKPDEIRVAFTDSRERPAWNPYNPLPAEGDAKAKDAAKTRDFSAEHIDADAQPKIRTAGAQTGRRRKRVLTYTREWNGIPESVANSLFLEIMGKDLEPFVKGFGGNIVEFEKNNRQLPPALQRLLPKE